MLIIEKDLKLEIGPILVLNYGLTALSPVSTVFREHLYFSLQVLPSPSPTLYKEATHLFADFGRLKPGDFRVDVAAATSQGVTCLKPEYIADYLMQVSAALHIVCRSALN